MSVGIPQLKGIQTVWVDPEVEDHPIISQVLSRLPAARVREGTPENPGKMASPIPMDRVKRQLYLTKGKGNRVKPCPGSPGRICCGYWVINAMLQCPMDCHYCILQDYLTVPAMTLYVNEEDVRREIQHRLAVRPGHICRFGTGELGDSLVHDALTGFSRRMVPFFARTQNGILELKTKTAAIETLEGLSPKGHTVISWSLNPPEVIRQVEPGTASLTQRIEAARRCQARGYWVGFHLDPVVWFNGWETAYETLINQLAASIDPERVLWISLAGFRYIRHQKETIRRRFGGTFLFAGEFFRDEDGKYRYLRRERISMYQKILKWLRAWSPGLFIYYCMESRRVWEETFPDPPRHTGELDERFHRHIWSRLRKD